MSPITPTVSADPGGSGGAVEIGNAPHATCGCERLRGAFAAPRCGARRRDGGDCRQAAMVNGRCRMHGGKSTGARTEAGKAKAGAANLRHGYYSAAAVARRREARLALSCQTALERDPGSASNRDPIVSVA